MKSDTPKLSSPERAELIKILRERFQKNEDRHKAINWRDVELKLEASPDQLWSIQQMEETGGEPDVIGQDKKQAAISSVIFRRKAQKEEEAFVLTEKRSMQGKNTSLRTAPWKWLQPWVFNC